MLRAMKLSRGLAFILVSLALAACGGKSGSSTTPADRTGGGAASGPLAPGAWDGMDEHARAQFMKNTVVPVMAAKFKAFDADKFAEIDCKTCHGPGAAEGKFDMPSGALPELDFQHPDPDDKAIAEFMAKEVKPTMANLLGEPEYTPDNPTGFGCMHCHTMAKAE
jgi:hypothetical protein